MATYWHDARRLQKLSRRLEAAPHDDGDVKNCGLRHTIYSKEELADLLTMKARSYACGENSRDKLAVKSKLAEKLKTLQSFGLAEALECDVFQAIDAAYGPDDPRTLMAKRSFAVTLAL